MTTRSIDRHYADPLDVVWLATARRIGFTVVRADDVFASSDGRGTITIASGGHLDADDCLAQMIFHELCHSLVQGHESFELPDWGLENVDTRDEELEHACLRVQAHIAARYGLRSVLAPTTDFRAFYDRLGADPLEPRNTASSKLAIIAIGRSGRSPWAPHLENALQATAAIATAGDGMWPRESLLASRLEPPARHSSGLHGSWIGDRQCGACGWRDASGRCQVAGTPVKDAEPACDRFELTLDCHRCGACCREGYTSVTIDTGDPVISAHPELVVDRGEYLELARAGPRCIALAGNVDDTDGYRCSIYEQRPRCCRELERGGQHCLTARQRVGLSI